MEIFIASDHVGFKMKKYIISKSGLSFIDLGPYGSESCDYPEYAAKLSNEIYKSEFGRGILICGTGIGMSIAANRHRWIRAALCYNEEMVSLSRKHNCANVLVLGAYMVSNETALSCVDVFLKTDFAGVRHLRRLNAIQGGTRWPS